MALNPRDSAEYISTHSEQVKILPEGIEAASKLLIKGFEEESFGTSNWKSHELHEQASHYPFLVDWIFLVDTMNFSFWTSNEKKYNVTYKENTYTGYWSLCAAVNRAIDEGYNIASPAFYSTISMRELQHIFRSDSGTEISLLERRLQILHETGKCLVEKFNSTFASCVDQCQKSSQRLLQIITDNFPSYRDVAAFKNKKVSFYKRAQILIGDIWACYEGQGCGEFRDIDSLTIFADYRVPQVLLCLGALNYSEDLLRLLQTDEVLENGNEYEVEIRGCTIWAAELIKQNIEEKQRKGELKSFHCNSILIDHYLWEHRRKFFKEMEHIPYHKVRCIYY